MSYAEWVEILNMPSVLVLISIITFIVSYGAITLIRFGVTGQR